MFLESLFWTETRDERRTILKEGYNFHCQCEACDITEEEVQKEARDCELFKEEEMKMKMFKTVGTRESMLQEAECLKRMGRLAKGQTFCDLQTHLHLFYRIFHSIRINNFYFFLVYIVILGIF